MTRWIFILAVTALLLAACEKTICEPGETNHGGVFLHGDPDLATTR